MPVRVTSQDYTQGFSHGRTKGDHLCENGPRAAVGKAHDLCQFAANCRAWPVGGRWITGEVVAGSVNKVILVGNLGRDPEIRSMQSGDKVCNLALATSERWRDRNTNEMQERTEWHRVVLFNPNLVDVAEKYLHKGSKVYVEGQLQTRKWTDQSGQERYTTEVVLQRFRGELHMLDSRGGGESMGGGYDRGAYQPAGGSGPSGGARSGGQAPPPMDDLDDEIPF